MIWLQKNLSWMLMLSTVVASQVVIFGNIPGRVSKLENKMETLEAFVVNNNIQHATILQELANLERNVQRLLDLHVVQK